ncbi:hypothetical protein CGC21_1660 [Leishmania donovani]|uniref:Uncharacterized protein n=1 Tax=Leishmania donovani TaxID=5661 RepID=A0A504XNR4_LEIDO|nr:hypothetical protein CGC21_1660 [Leishmania donovani]
MTMNGTATENIAKKRQSVLDVGQRNQLEAMQAEVRRNNEQLTSLRRENKELRMVLQQTIRGQRNISVEDHYAKEEELLHNKMCVLKRSLNAVKGKNAELLKEIERATEENRFIQQEGNGVLEEDSAVAHKIRALENRLDKCLVKHNEVQTIRRTYETLLERLQLEQAGFNTQVSSTEQALQCADKELGDLVALWKSAAKARDAAKAEVSDLKAQLAAERQRQLKDLEERRVFIESKRQQLAKKHEALLLKISQQEERHARTMQRMNSVSGGSARRRGHRSRASSASLLSPADVEQLQKQKTAYLRLRDVTMGTNVADVLARLRERSDHHIQLKTTAAELEASMEQLDNERLALQSEWEEVNHRAGHALVSARVMRAARDMRSGADKESGTLCGAEGKDGEGDSNRNAEGVAGGADAIDYGLLADRRHERRLVLDEFRQHLHQRQDELEEAEEKHNWLSQLLREVDLGVQYLAEKLSISGAQAVDVSATSQQHQKQRSATQTSLTIDLLRNCGAKLQLMLEELSPEELDAVVRTDSGTSTAGAAASGAATTASAAAALTEDYPENEIHDRQELKMMSMATVQREQQKARKQTWAVVVRPVGHTPSLLPSLPAHRPAASALALFVSLLQHFDLAAGAAYTRLRKSAEMTRTGAAAASDLLGVSPTVMQQLANAAATPSSSLRHARNTSRSSSHCSTESDPVMQAYQLEQILVAAVLKRLSDRCCDSDQSIQDIGSVDARQPAASSVSTTARQPAQKHQPSSLKAPPWSAALSEPRRACKSPQQPDGGLLLPSVLSSPQGVARVDALHASFLPLLLVALLQRVSEGRGGDTQVTDAAVPKQKAGTNAAVLSLRQQRSCRDALHQLLPLYTHLLLQRQRAACAVVSSVVVALQACPCSRHDDGESTTEEEESRKRIQRLVHQGLCCSEVKQWLHAARLLSDTLARWTLEMAGVWLSVAGMPRQGDTPVAEGRRPSDLWWWEAGMSVSSGAAQPDPDGSTLATSGASKNPQDCAPFTAATTTTAEALALAEVMCAVGEETCNDIWPHEGGHSGEQQQLPPSSCAVVGGRIVAMLRDVMAFFLARHHDSRVFDPLRTLSASEVTATEPGHRYVLLLAERLETAQRHQHRLLAAAERAVHRVLQQQHRQDLSVLWKPPWMIVALCSVTAYQLRTQLHRREQRMAELYTATAATATGAMIASPHMNIDSLPPSGSVAVTDPKRRSSSDEVDRDSRHGRYSSGGAPSTAAAAKPAQLGKWLWSEEDDDDAAAPHEKSQGQWCARSLDEGAGLAAHAAVLSSTAGPATTTSAAAAADTTISMPSPPPPPLAVSSAPSSVHALAPLRYTPRTSSLHHGSRIYGTLPAMHGSGDASAAADEDAGDGERLARGSNDYYAPARSMERLWELPARVPRDWTPALATLMACCVLCLSSTSTTAAASRLAVLLGETLLSRHSAEAELAHNTASTSLSGSAFEPLARPVASPRASLPDFSFSKRHEASAATAAGVSVRSSVCSSSATNSIADVSMAVDSTDRGGEFASSVVAVGALAQWHLRGLIRQLCLPVNGRVLPSEQAGRDRLRGRHTKASRTRSAAGSSSLALLSNAVDRTSATPSSAGAVAGGDSWFTRYNQTTRARSRVLDAAMRSDRRGADAAASSSLPPAGGVLRRLDPVSLLASCFALMHLLQTQPRFFQKARLGGRTMQELRLGVLEARWGGEPGCAAQMLQRHGSATSIVTVSVNSVSRALVDGTAGGHADPRAGGADASRRRRDAFRFAPAAAATCNFTEALLVVVSYVGCRALATALVQLAAPALDSAEAVDASFIPCLGSGIAPAVTFSAPPRDLWCDALQAITGLLLEAHRAHRGGTAASRVRAVAAAASRSSVDHHDSTRACSHGILSSASRSVDRASTLASTATATVGVLLPASRASASTSVSPQPSDPRQALGLGSAPTAPSFHASRPVGDGGRGAHAAAPPHIAITATHLMPAPLSTEAQFGIGAFFFALVRALLQLHALSSAAATCCLYAVASIIDDVLHDYSNPPPAVLCDVLAIMLMIQPLHQPSATVQEAGAIVPPPPVSDTLTAWEALRLTPFWDGALLGPLEAASRAWACHEERSTAAPSDNGEERRSSDRQRGRPPRSATRLCESPSASHIPSPPQPSRPPWQSLLGHLPCSRDPFSTSWLPAAFRGPSRSSTSWTLLALLAKEDDLLLADPPTATAANTADEIRQLSVSIVASARYTEWMETLCEAWQA